MSSHLDRIRQARIHLLLDEPFFGSLLMNLKPIEDRTVKTFCTDTKVLRFNPEFMDKLSDAELRTILAHEVLHCGLLHPFRRGARDLKRFNKAADYAINNFLDKYNQEATKRNQAEPFPLKNIGLLLDHTFDNLSAEEIYAKLMEPPSGGGGQQKPQPQSGQSGQGADNGGQPQPGGEPQPGQGGPQGPPSGPTPHSALHTPHSDEGVGEFTDAAKDEAQRAEGEAEWKVALQQAAIAAKSQGRLPGDAERFIKEFLEPSVPWTELLRTFLTSTAKDDYSWSRPNRRYASSGLILPSMHSPHLGPVIVAVDTSGSIGQAEFDRFISEVRAILFDCKPEKLILAQCDARLQSWEEIEPFEDLGQVKFKGGGGTSFRPVFQRALDEPELPAALIYLTDLCGSFPDAPPPFPVLWASTTNSTAPFGDTIHI